MILLYPLSEMPKVIRKTYTLDEDVFVKLRDFYRVNRDMRHHKAVVYQERVDYSREENTNKLLIEIYAQEKKDPIKRTLDYICVLEAVPRCDALLANVSCGVVTYSLGRKQDYEFVDVRKIR